MAHHRGYILIVDDERDIREALAELLVESGHDAKVAANGREALDVLRGAARPCLILLDLMMPIMDGAEFSRHKNRDPDLSSVPVCIVTAKEPPGPAPVGAVAVIRKPIDTEALMSIVERHC